MSAEPEQKIWTPPTHSWVIRVVSADGEDIYEDNDFAEDARFDWFDEMLRNTAEIGESVELMDTSNGHIVLTVVKKD